MAVDDGSLSGHAADVVIATARELVAETRPRAAHRPLSLDARLDRDIGLDSLAVVELAARLEDAFGTRIPEHELGSAGTLRDLLTAVGRTGPAPAEPPRRSTPLGAEAAVAASGARTLVEALEWHAQHHATRTHVRILGDSVTELTYGALRDEAGRIAAGLQARGVARGSSVALMLATGPAYFTAFFGVLLAGGVPVPIYPPARPDQLEEHVARHTRILDNAGAVALIADPEAATAARLICARVPSLATVTTAAHLRAAAPGAVVAPAAHDLGLVQYTSGSTGDPKGVMLTHDNLLANIRAMSQAGRVSSTDVFASWLPLYHDMGLIGAWLTSLVVGLPLVVMSPLRFLARPARWLRAIHEHGATISGGPNFGYELCLRRIDDDELDGVDLRSWRVAFNGAEPVSPATVTRFAQRFAPFGLRREAVVPVYGLAECSVALTVPPLGRRPRIDRVAREPLARDGRAEPVAAPEQSPGQDPGQDPDQSLGQDAAAYVACGPPLVGHEIRIVDGDGRPLAERRQGQIQFRGPSATLGYLRNPAASDALFDGPWLRSGDLGYLADGELFVTGRVKDLIIRAGRNLHPADLEQAVGALPGVRSGCVAVFGSTDPVSQTERLVVLAETRETDPSRREAIHDAIVQTTSDIVGTPPDDVVLTVPRAVPKTSSGKIRRSVARQRYEDGTAQAGHRALWRQVGRTALGSAVAVMRRRLTALPRVVYGLYARAVFTVVAVAASVLIAVLPAARWRWTVVRAAGRAVLALCAVRLHARGARLLPAGRPYVVVANHASYLDPLLIALAAGRPVTFAAVGGLAANPVLRLLLERLGVELVGRHPARVDGSVTHAFEQALRSGRVVAFFPEGRRSTSGGIEPFRMGAFLVAAHSGHPVVPVAIRGTRQLLPAHRRLPRRVALEVTITEPVTADPLAARAARDTTRAQWETAKQLHDAARAAIVRHSGETDLA